MICRLPGNVLYMKYESRYSRSEKRSEEHTSELQSPCNLVCRLLLEKKKHLRPDQVNLITNHALAVSVVDALAACPARVDPGAYAASEGLFADQLVQWPQVSHALPAS